MQSRHATYELLNLCTPNWQLRAEPGFFKLIQVRAWLISARYSGSPARVLLRNSGPGLEQNLEKAGGPGRSPPQASAKAA